MPILQVYVDDATHKRLKRAAQQKGDAVDNLAEAAVAEAALDWAKANGFPGEDKPDLHPMKAGIQQDDKPDLHRHPIHDEIETESEGEK
ncbi:MAG: hypothetical protein ACJ75S_06870 [Solirubrobacterales bacterium]|jgi:hypothetical protein